VYVYVVDTANRQLVAAKGGVEAIVHVLCTHINNADLALEACTGLCELAYDNGMRAFALISIQNADASRMNFDVNG
jgi:hypothetical protein